MFYATGPKELMWKAVTCGLFWISKLPVQYGNSEIFVYPDLATQLLKIPILSRFNSLLCQKGE